MFGSEGVPHDSIVEPGKSLEGLEPANPNDRTSQAGRVPATSATEDLMTVEDRNRRSGQHDKWIIADSLREVQLGEWGDVRSDRERRELE
jgi:hypothetical protein